MNCGQCFFEIIETFTHGEGWKQSLFSAKNAFNITPKIVLKTLSYT